MTAHHASARVALIGDSIFDSKAYMYAEPHMAARLTRLAGGAADLLARSGSRMRDIERQIRQVSQEATHLVASVGGNDLIDIGWGFQNGASIDAGVLARLQGALQDFTRRHAHVCASIASAGKFAAVCTIYQPPVAHSLLRAVSASILGAVNDAIARNAADHRLDVIDLHNVCRDPQDFIDPIHPSPAGADKIAAAIARWVDASLRTPRPEMNRSAQG